jgi:GNAT superfamily N-acetyltransferase
MKSSNPELPHGFSLVPPGKLASAVTCLETRDGPSESRTPDAARLSLARWEGDDLDFYRALFRAVGEDWLWFSRLALSDQELRALLHDPAIETYVLSDGEGQIGLVELDFRQAAECELVFLGVIKRAIGRGAGGHLMDRALAIAWSHPIKRFWLHTCHLDHPNALTFYQRFGLRPYAHWVEVFDDPRIIGVLPRTVASHVPILD